MDVNQALKDTENALRDFIALVFSQKHGQDWLQHVGLDPEKIKKWQERQVEDAKRLGTGSDHRLLYYADFYDIQTILEKNWQKVPALAAALGEKKELMLWLKKLETYRNPDAHRRELLPHQKHLVLGIDGEIRTRLIQYPNKQEEVDDYFPRIEYIQDSLGNSVAAPRTGTEVTTEMKLRPGDKIDFVITARDPLGEQLQYGISTQGGGRATWSNENTISLVIDNSHVGIRFPVHLIVKSDRKFHAHPVGDSFVAFIYQVLPPRSATNAPSS